MTPTIFFSRRWRFATVLVVIGMIFLSQLGLWQLDRRDQRRAENARILAQLEQNPLVLDGTVQWDDPTELDDRKAQVTGRFDYANQLAIKNSEWFGTPGLDLVTPLIIDGTDTATPKAILINRGWVPYAQSGAEFWPQFQERDTAPIVGYIQKAEVRPGGPSDEPLVLPQAEWFRVDVAGIQGQMPYELLPFYIMWQPEGNAAAQSILPYRHLVEFDLSEGSHFSYAVQWFLFAAMFGVGYVYYVYKDNRERPE